MLFTFLQFPSRELPGIWTKSDSLEWKLQGFRPAEMAKMAKMLDQEVWELLTELQLNGVLKRRKRGSSQLGGVSNV